jgi:AAA domain
VEKTVVDAETSEQKPTTYQADLQKLPAALTLLKAKNRWAVWRWESRDNGTWQKPPFPVRSMHRHASIYQPDDWVSYDEALAVVQSGAADGLTFLLQHDAELCAIDCDKCRDPRNGNIDEWAQCLIEKSFLRGGYCEITVSGTGLRIIGLSAAASEEHTVNKKLRVFDHERHDPQASVEIFRRAFKPITISGLSLNPFNELGNIDWLIDSTVQFYTPKPEPEVTAKAKKDDKSLAERDCSNAELETRIDNFVVEDKGKNRSNEFHSVVFSLAWRGWSIEEIIERFEQSPEGLASKYIKNGRLEEHVKRSHGKWEKQHGAEFKTPPEPEPPPEAEYEAPDPEEKQEGEEAEEGDADTGGAEQEEPRAGEFALPKMYAYGEVDPLESRDWRVRELIPPTGAGLISGQWGTLKTFLAFELSACIITAKPFARFVVDKPGGVLLFAAEGEEEVPLRLDGVLKHKYGFPHPRHSAVFRRTLAAREGRPDQVTQDGGIRRTRARPRIQCGSCANSHRHGCRGRWVPQTG